MTRATVVEAAELLRKCLGGQGKSPRFFTQGSGITAGRPTRSGGHRGPSQGFGRRGCARKLLTALGGPTRLIPCRETSS